MRMLAALLLLIAPTSALAQICDGAAVVMANDGRVYGHLPYGDAAEGELVSAPPGFSIGQPCYVRPEVFADLQRLLAAAAGDAAMMGQLRGLSCHRSILRQASVFCREHPAGAAAERAISVAPPGHSEHSTGYVIDFAVRPSPNCPDAEACMAATPAARWLLANAPRFGFEMSFPGGNKQNVKWEPWHWRWVGTSAAAPGAARARFVFARARRDFPAEPGIVDMIVLRTVPTPPVFLTDVPAPLCRKGKCKPPKAAKAPRRR